MSNSESNSITIGLDPFCFKQFDKKGINFIPYPKESFLEKVRECLKNGGVLRDGYAPFCKHLLIKNFTEATCSAIEITEENEHLLKSGYLARTSKELPVLTRWFRKNDVLKYIKKAEYLDVILYSREQVIKESKAMKSFEDESHYSHDYYIISIKPQNEDYELPMLPITVMRNALIDQGGSGVPIDRKTYERSVEYWSKYAVFYEDA
ncbi:conserved hypothetical protein [Theileria orientalis strain Shintoku]|uniref:Uncharacterized protein n=1 Tax=Theileria orientalis strain Shintoku TaxID=869250 RepID=J4C8K3_THEOR|nr:conserved hypothetical protein [Theileria orientalis strain Shintoku]BAM40938.1 conserved hypothetical protein [Theileria orientalis strain Shintoku]|eukprot:XP_009691239.1 conserved hypothetical protein [Theileria orientalis strain Shintoku]